MHIRLRALLLVYSSLTQTISAPG